MQTRLPTETRQSEIVAAALQLARSMSPALITTTHMAQAVGVSQGTVFKHFDSKDAVWLAAMCWVRGELMAALEAAADGQATPLDALQAVFDTHIGFVVAHPGVPRLMFHELQRPADSPIKQAVRELLGAYRKLLLRILSQADAQAALVAGTDLGAAATLFVGMVQGLVMQSMASGGTASLKPQAGAMFAIYRCGIAGAACLVAGSKGAANHTPKRAETSPARLRARQDSA